MCSKVIFPTLDPIKCFVCRACFSEAAKGERALQSTRYELNSLRKKVGRPDVHLSLACEQLTDSSSDNVDDRPPSPPPQRASMSTLPPAKRARRSLFSTPPGCPQSSSPLVQVIVLARTTKARH